MKRLFIVISILAISLSPTITQGLDVSDMDGNMWREWAANVKTFFILGFISGTGSIGDELKRHKFILARPPIKVDDTNSFEYLAPISAYIEAEGKSSKSKRTFSSKEVSFILDFTVRMEQSSIERYNILGITVGQLVDGLNTFYGDFKNRRIRISEAIYVVKKQIEGAPRDEIEFLCEWLRGSERDIKKRFYKKDGEDVGITFP